MTDKTLDPCGSDSSTELGAPVNVVEILPTRIWIESDMMVEILPTRIWIESDMMGSRHVMVHHEGFGDPFAYATFHYNYAYTSNAGTWDAAHRLALSLGATEPVEKRHRGLHMPTAEELREEIALMQEALAEMEAPNTTDDRPSVRSITELG